MTALMSERMKLRTPPGRTSAYPVAVLTPLERNFVGIPFGGANPGRLLPAASARSAAGATPESNFIHTVEPCGMSIGAADADCQPATARIDPATADLGMRIFALQPQKGTPMLRI